MALLCITPDTRIAGDRMNNTELSFDCIIAVNC
jgi:hypothetical protein